MRHRTLAAMTAAILISELASSSAAQPKLIRTIILLPAHMQFHPGAGPLRFCRDGTSLVSAGIAGSYVFGPGIHYVQTWEFASGEIIANLEFNLRNRTSTYNMSVSPDGKTAVGACSDGSVRMWNLKTQKVRVFRKRLGAGRVFHVQFSPDGKLLAGRSHNNTITIWNAAIRKPLFILTGHTHKTVALAFSPDSRIVASGSFDNTVRLWDTASGKSIAVLRTDWNLEAPKNTVQTRRQKKNHFIGM
jgi:hypothetical protein